MEIQVKIKNLPQIKAAFRRSPILMMRELNIAIKKWASKTEGVSRMKTPVAKPWTWKRPVKGYIGGRLRASTYQKVTNLRGEVGTNTDYDIFVHEGTRFMKGRPYLRQAVEQTEQDTDRYFFTAVDNVLKQIAREAG